MVSGFGKSGGFLDRIEQAFDWSAFEALLAPIHASTRGAPGYPPLMMFKILLLQQWHRLSDPGAEEAVRDRLSFRRCLTDCRCRRTRRTRFDLALPSDDRQARPFGGSAFRDEPAARCARPHRQARHVGGRDPDRGIGQKAALRGRRGQPARSGRAGDDEAEDGSFRLQGASGGG